MKYPSEGQGDFVQFGHQKYSAKGGGGGGGGITLYIPNQAPPVTSSQNWAAQDFKGPLGQARLSAAKNVGSAILAAPNIDKKSISDMVGNFTSDVEKGGGFGEAARQGGLEAVAGLAGVGSASNLLALQNGEVYNPNTELIYQNPQFRSFSFDFTFIPKNEGDAQAACQIIKEFKTYSAPEVKQKGRLEIPHVWSIRYSNQYMGKFKQCALLGVTVQYNPGLSQHVTFPSGMPIVTALNLQFQEVEYVFRKDHQQGLVGY